MAYYSVGYNIPLTSRSQEAQSSITQICISMYSLELGGNGAIAKLHTSIHKYTVVNITEI